MKIGIIATSQKTCERRLPLHPEQLSLIEPSILEQMRFERGYGEAFGVCDAQLALLSAGVAEKDELLRESDLVILAKPEASDALKMKPGSTLWGWVHCVQNPSIVQAAIDRRLTYIAWEIMNLWNPLGEYQSHIFYRNNQIAGYAAVMHAIHLRGMDGNYGPKKKVVLINTGQVSTGALHGLQRLGFTDISVFTTQKGEEIPADFDSQECFELDISDPSYLYVSDNRGERRPFIDVLRGADIIVNGILQNPLRPLMFLQEEQLSGLKRNSLIIDISCDTGMGFSFAQATSFEDPMRRIGNTFYYAVDHTPSFLWESATWEISEALRPFLSTVTRGKASQEQCPTIRKAIEIHNGIILNPAILEFQNRAQEYPHNILLKSSRTLVPA